MIAKTQEGLIGANNAMNSIRTPMKVYREARAKGDTAAMERAMGYAGDINDDARKHKNSADEGLKQEAKENKANAEKEREELAQRIEENRDRLDSRIYDGRSGDLRTATDVTGHLSRENGEASAEQRADVNKTVQIGETTELNYGFDKAVVYDNRGKVTAATVGGAEFDVVG